MNNLDDITTKVGDVATMDSKTDQWLIADDQKVCENCPTILNENDFFVCNDCEDELSEQENEK